MNNSHVWQLISPEGVIQAESFHFAARPGITSVKTVLFRWNGKHNGDIFLNRIAELLARNNRDVKIIKAWEKFPETLQISLSPQRSQEIAALLAACKPDIVIAGQGD